jgi:hypothetical protein
MIQKKWKKSPENPLNQQHVAYNATKDEIREVKASIGQAELDCFKK